MYDNGQIPRLNSFRPTTYDLRFDLRFDLRPLEYYPNALPTELRGQVRSEISHTRTDLTA
jgi:hypothetical protein